MSLLGTYLTLSIDGSVIADTTSVSMKMKARPIDVTSHDTGLHGAFEGGKVSVAMAGSYLFASSGSNWDALWSAFNSGTEVAVNLLRYGGTLLTGYATIVKLRANGGKSDRATTGGYGLRFRYVAEQPDSITSDSTIITVDSTLITADAI